MYYRRFATDILLRVKAMYYRRFATVHKSLVSECIATVSRSMNDVIRDSMRDSLVARLTPTATCIYILVRAKGYIYTYYIYILVGAKGYI